MKKEKPIKSILSITLAVVIAVSMAACGKENNGGEKNSESAVITANSGSDANYVVPLSENLMDGFRAETVSHKNTDDRFKSEQLRLCVDLFKESVSRRKDNKENVLVSPLSIQLALSMTANGANGETLNEMQKVLGGEISIDELNKYLHSYVNSLPSDENSKLNIANSIWFRDEKDRLTVKNDFLQINANYYGAQAYKLPFNSDTLGKINGWVKEHTDGMIDKVIDKIEPDSIMYLINALTFDAKWQEVYEASQLADCEFTSANGEKQRIKMMYSDESTYISDGKAEGFIRPYRNNTYSFAALMPKNGDNIYDYISSLTVEDIQNALCNGEHNGVSAGIPKFSYTYEVNMNNILKTLGMPLAFDVDRADFSNLGKSAYGNIFIGNVLHKTFIAVDELGTKAGAVTVVDAKDECAEMVEHTVYLDHPFIYMIVDNATNLPVFIGAVTDLSPT